MSQLRTIRVGSGRPELWLIAGVHGDEVEGMVVVEEALRSIEPERGTIVGLPVAHPDALARGTRLGPEGTDLNRTYPGRADGTPTERIAHELWRLLEEARPSAIVTFHSWSRSGSATPYVEHQVGDEAGRNLALALGLPFVEALDWPAGELGREVRTLGIPSAELELFGLGCHSDEGLTYGLQAARGAAAWLDMIGSAPARASTEVDRLTLTAPGPGRVVQCAALGSSVTRGDRVAELRDAAGTTTAVLAAEASGWVGIHVTFGQVVAGDPVTVIFVPRGSEEP